MILADFECPRGHIHEALVESGRRAVRCPACGRKARRIVSAGRVYTGNQDAPWLKSVLEVVDRDSKAPHVQAFVRNPTRENYRAWMKGEGIRPMDHTEHGGPPLARKPPEPDLANLRRLVTEAHFQRKRIEVRD